MDVGAPSNFDRMLNLFGGHWEQMKGRVSGFSFDDQETRATIRNVFKQTGYSLDPHGAVGWLASNTWRESNPDSQTVVLETAHPSKFIDVMEEELGEEVIEVPERLACLSQRKKVAVQIGADKASFHDWLLKLRD